MYQPGAASLLRERPRNLHESIGRDDDMTLRPLVADRRLALVLATAAACAVLGGFAGQATARMAPQARPSDLRETRQLAGWQSEIFSVAWDLINSRPGRAAAEYALEHAGLPYACQQGWLPSFFCPGQQQPSYGVGLAYYANTPVWNANGQVVYQLAQNTPLKLVCFAFGGSQTVGQLTSDLYYRLTNGDWVNDAWIYTGTNSVIAGVPHC
jgi:hypothetical protein